jgi:hypothetical protein
MNAPVVIAPVRKSVRVKAPVARAFAVASRCNFNCGQGFFACNRAGGARCRAGPWTFCKWRDDRIVPLICPTCQNVFAGFAQSLPASDHHATLHGVVFDIFS